MTSQDSPRTPDFFIAGAPKAGTTTLHAALASHPDVFLPERKEPDHFSAPDLLQQRLYYQETPVADWQDYVALFEPARDVRCAGEASVSYLFYPRVAGRIHRRIPAARIILVLRDPIERAWSHYLMDQRLGLVQAGFAEIVAGGREHGDFWQYHQQYLQLGLYHDQVERYFSVFGADQVLVLRFEALAADLGRTLARVCRFLEIDASRLSGTTRPSNVYQSAGNPAVARLYAHRGLRRTLKRLLPGALASGLKNRLLSRTDKPELSADTRAILTDYYANDVARLAVLIGEDLSGWCRADENSRPGVSA